MRFIYFLAIITFFSSASNAQDSSDAIPQSDAGVGSKHSPPLLDHEKLYVDFLLGLAKQETEGQQGLSFSDDSFSFGLRSGYSINPYLAAELGFAFHGTSEAEGQVSASSTTKSKISSSSINAGIKATLPLSDQFLVSASVGMARWSADIELSDAAAVGAPYKGEDSGYDPYYGGSFVYKPNETFYFGIEYTAYEYDYRVQSVEMTQSIDTIALLFGTKI